MRWLFVSLALLAIAAAIPPPVSQRAADKNFLKIQQDVIYLFEHITEELPNAELRQLGLNYQFQYDLYSEPEVVKYFVRYVERGYAFPRGVAYSISISEYRKEIALLTRIFLAANDYTTLLKTAAWARLNLNEHVFVKAFSSAILQRADTRGIVLPPPYEIFPQYFLDSRVIQQAQNILTTGVENPLAEHVINIPVNYTSYLPYGEDRLTYFTDDIGLNGYYDYVMLAGYMLPEHPHEWYNKYQQYVSQCCATNPEFTSQQGAHTSEPHIGRGSRFYYIHQQLLARYHLERLSNRLGPIREADYLNVRTPYKPNLRFSNGLEFPGRYYDIPLSPYRDELIKTVWTIERRLTDAIDAGYVKTPQNVFLSLYQPFGLDILGDLIEGTGRSINPRYYGVFQAAARQLLGAGPEYRDIRGYTPSVLEVGVTALRDPVFYQLYKRVINLFKDYQESLPSYQDCDLYVPGVTVENVEVDKLITYFTDYNIDIQSATARPSNANQRENLRLQAQLKRLDHKPYEYKIVVKNEKNVGKVVVRVYLGPKYNYDGTPVSIRRDRLYFVELDQFMYELQNGENVIVRNSRQAPGFSDDYPSVQQLLRNVKEATRSQNPFYITEPEDIYGFPARLMLPRGRQEGFPLQFLVVISPYEISQTTPYGPVVSRQFQTYLKPYYDILNEEDYIKYTDSPHGWNRTTLYETVHGVAGETEYYSHHHSTTTSQKHRTGEWSHSVHQQGQTMTDSYLKDYWSNQPVQNIIGGVVSLDGRPLGYPLERPLAPGALYVPNIKVVDVQVYCEDALTC
ncbi:hexamerin [Cephus cinctus]|uniref:Hexamerin n=1 Tax=Cephus cinctus TaxID=211228 RepID=A0AAJ7C9Y1_CEPCN|nr:hexamerin [Cephus cinctus]